MIGSKQEWVGRVRPPRVQITYDVEIGGAIEMKELPFIVGIVADLSGHPTEPLPPLKERKFVVIDRDNFDDVLESIGPRLQIKVDNVLQGDGELALELIFRSVEDFSPLNLVTNIAPLNDLYTSRCQLRDLLGKLDGNDALNDLLQTTVDDAGKRDAIKGAFTDVEDPANMEESDDIKMIIDAGMARDESQRPYARILLASLATEILSNDELSAGTDITAAIIERIAGIDHVISGQLNVVLHNEDFQTLEATWRGLSFLVMNTETGTMLKLRILNTSKDDLLKDLKKAVEFDQSGLFKLVYEEEYGTFGGHPYSILLGAYEFGRHPTDMELLEKLSGVAAAAHAPFLASAHCKIFDLDSYSDLSRPRDLAKIFESAELIKWRSFRESEDSRYVTLTLPRVLLRLPYGEATIPVEGLNFDEDTDGRNHEKYLWGNPAFVLAQRITNAYSLYGWTAAIRGVEGGGLVENLPAHTFRTDEGDIALKCPTEIALTDRREKELSELGFISICHCKGTDKAAFFGGQSTNKPKVFNTNEANANARISAMLPYMLAASRFAHYLKVMMRDKVGSFMTRGNVEEYLNTWIVNYVLLDDSAGQEVKAKYPLREARIDVSEIPGRPGTYNAVVFLKPHFQLEELTASIRLVAELPPPAG